MRQKVYSCFFAVNKSKCVKVNISKILCAAQITWSLQDVSGVPTLLVSRCAKGGGGQMPVLAGDLIMRPEPKGAKIRTLILSIKRFLMQTVCIMDK